MVAALRARVDNATVVVLPQYAPHRCRHGLERDALRNGSAGSLPAFLLIGAHNAGTSSLYYNLAQHGDVRPGPCKEPHFFDDDRRSDWGNATALVAAYRSYFPNASGPFVSGDGTPRYLRHPTAPARAAAVVPEAKLIVLLRDPAERFMSNYVTDRKVGAAHGSCAADFRAGAAAFRECEQRRGTATCAERMADASVVRSIYAPQLDRWLAHFPELLAVRSGAMFANASPILQRVARFLGLRPFTAAELARARRVGRNHTSKYGNGSTSDFDCDPARLRAWYAPYAVWDHPETTVEVIGSGTHRDVA